MKRPSAKAMILINQLMEESKESTKMAAWAFFNKCDLTDLVNDHTCKVEHERVQSFLEYAHSKGVEPMAGLLTFDGKSQCFFI